MTLSWKKPCSLWCLSSPSNQAGGSSKEKPFGSSAQPSFSCHVLLFGLAAHKDRTSGTSAELLK